METINYKGTEYPCKWLRIIKDGEETDIKIAVSRLAEAMGDLMNYPNTVEEDIDCDIYYYVTDEQILLSDEIIAREHLDEPFELFIEED